jgi:hypothetical protein
MKKLCLFLVFLPSVLFCQESVSFRFDLPNNRPLFYEAPISFGLDLYDDDSSSDDKTEYTLSEKLELTFALIGVPLLWGGISYYVKEVVYRNNYSENWLGTAHGVIMFSFLGGMLTTGILALTDIFFVKGNYPSTVYLIGMFAGLIAGGILAFVPPFNQAFRENNFLYYSTPGFAGCISIFSLFDLWKKE